MRSIQLIKADIEQILHEMTGIIIQQSDLDNRLELLDKRRDYLEKELKRSNVS